MFLPLISAFPLWCMLSVCCSLDWPCSLLLDPTWTTLAATGMDGTLPEEYVKSSLLFFFYILFEEISHIIRLILNIAISVCWCLLHNMRFFCSSFSRRYFRNLSNYLQLCAIILPFLIIPFRAATTWCVSTGDGYCVDPTLLQSAANASSFTLDINQACITASHIQWIVASLAYMVNAILVMEFLTLFR